MQPPSNLMAEAAVLGAILFDNHSLSMVDQILREEDFYSSQHGAIFRICHEMIKADQIADGVTLAEYFKTQEIAGLGGQDYLEKLLDGAAFGPEITAYARAIVDTALRRRLMAAGQELAHKAEAGEGIAALEDHERDLTELREKQDGQVSFACAAMDVDGIIAKEGDAPSLLKTGIRVLDEELKGFERGAVSLIGARPGVGKTALAVCIAGNIAAHESVGFFSLDMSGRIINQRLACYLAGREGHHVPPVSALKEPGAVSEAQALALREAMRSREAHCFFTNDRAGTTVGQVAAQIRGWKALCERMNMPPLGAVFIDHVAKVAPRQNASNLYEKTTFAINELLDVAKQHTDVAMICLAQLNRAVNSGGGIPREPDASTLRDSGKLEEDASAIILLHREDMYWQRIADDPLASEDDKAEARNALMKCKGKMKIIIDKNRNNKLCSVSLFHSIGQNMVRDHRDNPLRRAS